MILACLGRGFFWPQPSRRLSAIGELSDGKIRFFSCEPPLLCIVFPVAQRLLAACWDILWATGTTIHLERFSRKNRIFATENSPIGRNFWSDLGHSWANGRPAPQDCIFVNFDIKSGWNKQHRTSEEDALIHWEQAYDLSWNRDDLVKSARCDNS